MRGRTGGLPVVSLILSAMALILMNLATVNDDEKIGFALVLMIIAIVCEIISIFSKHYTKTCAVIGLCLCILTVVSYSALQDKKYEDNMQTLSTYIITFDSDGGSAVEPIMVNQNTWLATPKNPTKDGYSFEGWYYNGQIFTFNRYVNDYVTNDITLKAKWIREERVGVTTGENLVAPNQNTGSQSSSKSSSSGYNKGSGSYSTGYQQIYNEYSQKLKAAGPTSSITEMAELVNEGVGKMARYMYSAKGTDGQYNTYQQWADKLYDVYMSECR